MNTARWIPLLRAVDSAGRNRGAAGAIVYNTRGAYARGAWVFFGVGNQDLFRKGLAFGSNVLAAVARTLVAKCFLHACETNFASYRTGEPVLLRVLVSNYSRRAAALKLQWAIQPVDGGSIVFEASKTVSLDPGQTAPVETAWSPSSFPDDLYRVSVRLFLDGAEIDQIEAGFNIWKSEILAKGLPFHFQEN